MERYARHTPSRVRLDEAAGVPEQPARAAEIFTDYILRQVRSRRYDVSSHDCWCWHVRVPQTLLGTQVPYIAYLECDARLMLTQDPSMRESFHDVGTLARPRYDWARDALMPMHLDFNLASESLEAMGEEVYIASLHEFTHAYQAWLRLRKGLSPQGLSKVHDDKRCGPSKFAVDTRTSTARMGDREWVDLSAIAMLTSEPAGTFPPLATAMTHMMYYLQETELSAYMTGAVEAVRRGQARDCTETQLWKALDESEEVCLEILPVLEYDNLERMWICEVLNYMVLGHKGLKAVETRQPDGSVKKGTVEAGFDGESASRLVRDVMLPHIRRWKRRVQKYCAMAASGRGSERPSHDRLAARQWSVQHGVGAKEAMKADRLRGLVGECVGRALRRYMKSNR